MRNQKPYVKEYQNGILVYPITKENPYLFSPTKNIKPYFRMWQTIRNKYFTGKTIVK